MNQEAQTIEIPSLTDPDVIFGNIKHLPKYDTLPEDFKHRSGNRYVDFVSKWFSNGCTKEDIDLLTAKSGIDKNKALRAIKSVLASFEPKHEHKEAGAAYLLSQWFELGDAK